MRPAGFSRRTGLGLFLLVLAGVVLWTAGLRWDWRVATAALALTVLGLESLWSGWRGKNSLMDRFWM